MKWEDYKGYGFTFHERLIYTVDEGSPSQAAGLCQNDRIIEVNNLNIDSDTHEQVIDLMKIFSNELKLLVIDEAAEKYFNDNNIFINGDMPNIKVI